MTDHHNLPAILFVDDEATAIKYFQRAIDSLAPVVTATSVEEGKQLLDKHAASISVLISDQRMPGAYGNELLAYARDRYPHVVRILTTAYSEIDHTVEAVNEGQIHRYIQKPWEINALKMELKQALALSRLHQEHAQLVREKLVVRQKQTVGSRIGTLCSLFATLAQPEGVAPAEAYLSAAALAGVAPAEPDWLLMDYADLVAAEADRGAAFGRAVRAELVRFDDLQPGPDPEKAISLLSHEFGNTIAPAPGGAIFLDGAQLTEFLSTPVSSGPSQAHAAWCAALLWLARRGWTFAASHEGGAVRVRLVPVGSALTPDQLAAWVDRL